MVDSAQLDRVLVPIESWVRSRPDILGLALVGSQARGTARRDSDIDLVLLASEPRTFRQTDDWFADIHWTQARIVDWSDTNYGVAWSRHVRVEPFGELEFTFCPRSWAATDPIDPGTSRVISMGCRILVDKIGLFGTLLALNPS
jgi:predicted nucleotidyltransferase